MEISKCMDKFVDMLDKLKVEGKIFGPLLSEMLKQIENKKPDILKIRQEIKNVRETKGYESRFDEALNFVSNNWGDRQVVNTNQNLTMTTTSNRGIVSRYQESLVKQESLKKEQQKLIKIENLKIVEKVSKLSKEDRFEKAFSELNLKKCEQWFCYLRDTKGTGVKKTLSKNVENFKTALKKAGELIDPLLKKRKIYDDSRSVKEDLKGALQSEAKETSIAIVLEHYELDDIKSPTHWFAKGMILFYNPDITIRCDGSAALAFYILATAKEFTGSIALVQQGENPRQSGHWFLVAGVQSDLVDDNINVFDAKEPKSKGWLFTVDLWGAFFQKLDMTVFYPAMCIAGGWKHKVLWKV